MTFASPVWLLGLLPWAVEVFFLLPGKGTPAVVPFLGLWQGPAAVSKRTARRWPGLSVLIALLALLLAILAAAQPSVRARSVEGGEISIVLDRGATMALPSASGKVFRNVIDRAGEIGEQSIVNLIPVPGQPIATTGETWAKTAGALSPTALRVELDQVVADRLRKTTGAVWVLSDQKLNVIDPRIMKVEPEAVVGTVAIIAVGARALPHPQVMVRLENPSDSARVLVTVQSGKATVQREVDLPARGQSSDQFLDLPALGPTVSAHLEFEGQKSPWLQAYLVQQPEGAMIAVDPTLDAAVRRLAMIYGKDRPAGAEARQILISNHELNRDQSGIWIAESSTGKSGSPVVVPHQVTQNVRSWPPAGTAKIPAGFSAVVSVASDVVVAVREDSGRQLWVNAGLPEWEKTPDFVVFFADALRWLGDGEQVYTSVPPSMERDWPGNYQLDNGEKVAVNAGEFPKLLPSAEMAPPVGKFKSTDGQISISSPMIYAALGCLALSAMLWRTVQE